MYKLMIVDDEQIVLDAVTHIVNKIIKNVRITSCARNGREAIEKAREDHPDIILMDIRMPGINGIDAISEIRRFSPDTRFAIISAYEQFEFAKQAMELGVEHYILKPINRGVLVDTILKMVDQVRISNEKKKKELETVEKLEKLMPYLEQGFICSVLLNTVHDEELTKYMEIFNMDNPSGYIMIVQFGGGGKAEGVAGQIGSSIMGHENYPYVRDVFKLSCKCIVGPILIDKIVVYVCCEDFRDEYEFRLQTIKLADDMLKSIKKRIKTECFIGIGGYKSAREIVYSYNEAVNALWNNRGEPISHILDICGEQPRHIYDVRAADNIIAKIEMGDEEGAVAAFIKTVDRIDSISDISYESKKSVLIEYMVAIHRKAMEAGISEDSCLKYGDYIREMLSADNICSLVSWCISRIKYITRRSRDEKSEKGNSIVSRAKKFIRDNFQKEITLEELSKELNISPQYFSRLFKEETGYNFIEYLTFVRIEHSKRLMSSTGMTIKEICYSVGYGDPNYFSRLFKKNTGMSPTSYARVSGKKTGGETVD
ncbi:MAG: response regulator [Bacillota bacterium]